MLATNGVHVLVVALFRGGGLVLALGLAFESLEFKAVLRFRLGLPIRPAHSVRPVVCQECGEVEDPYGGHRLCCPKVSHTANYNKVTDILGRCIAAAGVPVEREVPIVLYKGMAKVSKDQQKIRDFAFTIPFAVKIEPTSILRHAKPKTANLRFSAFRVLEPSQV